MIRSNSDLPYPAYTEGSPSPTNVDTRPTSHDHADCHMENCDLSGTSAQSLPAGCVMGVPIAMGRPVSRVPELPVTLDLAIMRSIQADNYKFIRHMIMAGWSPVNPTACGFSITINRQGEREVWQVKRATPLHYAVCCGSLQAAAAILIAFPETASLSCKVECSSSHMPLESMWTTHDLTSFFGNLYMSLDEERHTAYKQASSVLLRLKQDPQSLPFMQHASPQERLAAAGTDALQVTSALFSAALG